MRDQDKTKDQLVNELVALRERIADLEASEREHKRAEKALWKSEERFRNIYEESPIGIELYDSGGKLIAVNKACLDIFGVLNVTEVKGFKLFEDPNVTDRIKERLHKGEVVRYEVAFDFEKVKTHKLYSTSKSGIIHINVLITPLGLQRGKPLGGYLVQVQDITERKQMEEKILRLNQSLRAVFNISQFIARERERDGLLKGVCDILVEAPRYCLVWVALLDESRRLVTTAEAGLGKDFLPIVKQWKRGRLPVCGQRALEQSEIVVTADPLSSCTDCPLADKYRGKSALTVRLEHLGKVYGLLSCGVSAYYAVEEEEQSLLQRIAGDIAFALHSIEVEEQRKRAVDSLFKLTRFLR